MERQAIDDDVLEAGTEASPGTLGGILYARRDRPVPSEGEWAGLVERIAAGDQVALHLLYQRAHRPVFTLAVRITGGRESAEEVTLDVFHDVWRRARDYDPANGTVLGWIMNQARSRSLDHVRFERRKKRVQRQDDAGEPAMAADPRDMLEFRQEAEALRAAVASLAPAERQAVEQAFFSDLTHAEVAERLDQPLGTVKTRIRSALQKLRQALGAAGSE
ncbi:MAG TPA: sigma-70 family RNA polymerase sigma factor [Usitatibacter sp.]|jgi:RNA polymerase sigma-70 factor (ECF subfamily)|nr:sigma-70 family RNA polymerase sigma factor [Usitatibacter sp.]